MTEVQIAVIYENIKSKGIVCPVCNLGDFVVLEANEDRADLYDFDYYDRQLAYLHCENCEGVTLHVDDLSEKNETPRTT